ncbi:DUF2384 domain-containing protein [Pseudoalteromonas sp. HF66]|uniref:DUF2384 domain-containing protein n=1 Tax=Pseudoalteromonas sp. HF66 TaxID=2721559 RepID=UPI00142FD5DC|nr:DUF2384 domain-containing protein [Pseudoalteromonas sp. HF66]NIZ05463.1 DUF2384 domain-containing protein [Pseudoalteromonas sp. HF66]
MSERNMVEFQASNTSKCDFISVVTQGELTTLSNPLAEIDFTNTGVTKDGVCALANSLSWSVEVIAQSLNTTSSKLIRHKSKKLNKQLSDSALDIARLGQFGVKYFGNIENFNCWLDTPVLLFNGEPPRHYMNSIRGRELIKQTVNKLKYSYTV